MPPDQTARVFRWTPALVLFGILFLGVSDTQLIPPLLDPIASEVGVSAGRAGTIVTVYAVAAASAALLLGPASDRIGRKRLISLALLVFAGASTITSQSSYFSTLLGARLLTGLAAGTLSTLALTYAADLYAYQHRGRAMGVLSMAYFVAFVVGIPLGTLVTARYSWRFVFAGLASAALLALAVTACCLPGDDRRSSPGGFRSVPAHFRYPERVAGVVAAFLTSGGLVAFLTYVGVWLAGPGVGVTQIGLLFMTAGIAATAASPLSGWLADRVGKIPVLLGANLALALLFLLVSRLDWGVGLFAGIGLVGVTASARQAPLHALTTELVGTEIRGSYVAVRNAASQLGIAALAALSAVAFDRFGFGAVAWIAAGATILVPVTCLWMRPPGALTPDS